MKDIKIILITIVISLCVYLLYSQTAPNISEFYTCSNPNSQCLDQEVVSIYIDPYNYSSFNPLSDRSSVQPTHLSREV